MRRKAATKQTGDEQVVPSRSVRLDVDASVQIFRSRSSRAARPSHALFPPGTDGGTRSSPETPGGVPNYGFFQGNGVKFPVPCLSRIPKDCFFLCFPRILVLLASECSLQMETPTGGFPSSMGNDHRPAVSGAHKNTLFTRRISLRFRGAIETSPGLSMLRRSFS